MKLQRFSRVAIVWVFIECLAFTARLIIHPQGFLGPINVAIVALGLGISALVGLGLGVVFWAAVKVLFAAISRASNVAMPWFHLGVIAVMIVAGTFCLSSITAVFEVGDALLYGVMVALSSTGFFCSVKAKHLLG